MTKQYEDLEPGDYLLYEGQPATRGTALQGYCVIAGDKMIFNVHPDDITLTDHLTINELRELPKGSVVETRESWQGYMDWTKVQIGRGQRWVATGGSFVTTSEEIAAKGATLVHQIDLIESGQSVVLENVVKTGKGNFQGTVDLGNGVVGRFLVIVK